MKSSPFIWRYVKSVKLTVKISSIFVAFLEEMNFTFSKRTNVHILVKKCDEQHFVRKNIEKQKMKKIGTS